MTKHLIHTSSRALTSHDTTDHYRAYRARARSWLSANGYETGSFRSLPARSGQITDILSHGFMAMHEDTGRWVMFGDPYETGLKSIEPLSTQYGLSIRRHTGLWNEGTTLLEVQIIDPLRAVFLFRTNQSGRYRHRQSAPMTSTIGAPIWMMHPSKLLGMPLGEIRAQLGDQL